MKQNSGVVMMKKMKTFGLVLFVLLGILMANFAVAASVPATIDFVTVDGTEITVSDTNRLDLQRGDSVAVKVKLTATANNSNVEIEAFLSGFEFSDIESVSDTTPLFDLEQGVSYVKTLRLKLPTKLEEDDYRLRVLVSDRNSDQIIQNYRIKIDVPRHALDIKDVVFSPEGRVQAGRALLAMVRVKNVGDKKEEGIKIRVNIPELGVSASDFIDEIKSQDATTSEELFLRIPTCAKPGLYEVNTVIEFNSGVSQVSKKSLIEVTGEPTCEPLTPQQKTIISLGTESLDIKQGGTGTYPITITNSGTTAKSFILSVAPVSWATTSISPGNVLVLNPNEAKTAYVLVAANENTPIGVQALTVSVKDSSGATLKEIALKSNITRGEGLGLGTSGFRRVLEIGLVALLIVLIIIGFVMVFSRRGKEEGKGDNYY